jgi:glycosyltransferase involved in cell wall biosynthesis
MFEGRSVAVILPTYREKATIRAVIEGFDRLGVVDDIIVVNNNAEPGTSEEVAGTAAREVVETLQGYGAAIRRGIRESSADLVCVCEPDGTFEPKDLQKLLAYSEDFQFVFGSRTVRELIWDGANMGHFLRWGNWAVAKEMELLFNTTSLSDVGCTMRVMDGPIVRRFEPIIENNGGILGPELMLLAIIGGWNVIQVPVNYKPRGGVAGTTERFLPAFRIGIGMIGMIWRYRRQRGEIAARLTASEAVSGPGSAGAARRGGKPNPMFLRRLRRTPEAVGRSSDNEGGKP